MKQEAIFDGEVNQSNDNEKNAGEKSMILSQKNIFDGQMKKC